MIGVFVAAPVLAQMAPATEADRATAGLDPLGIPAGGMRFLPEVGLETLYNDNVFAVDEGAEDDVSLILTPQVMLTGRSPNAEGEIGASMEIARQAELTTEDYDDWRLWATGRGVVGDGELFGELRFSNVHEDRTSPDDRGIGQITKFDTAILAGSYTYRPSRNFFRIDARFTSIEFGDTETIVGPVENSDRDRDVSQLGFRLGRAASPNFAYFGELRLDEVSFVEEIDRNGFDRSSDGFELRAGGTIDLTNVIQGEFFVGYISREYVDERFLDADGPTIGADISWAVTRLTTLDFFASRLIDDTTVLGASGITKTSFGVDVRHELRRDFSIAAGIGFLEDNFQGIERKDDIFTMELGGRYFMNNFLQLSFGYLREDRDTSPADIDGQRYKINRLYIKLLGQL